MHHQQDMESDTIKSTPTESTPTESQPIESQLIESQAAESNATESTPAEPTPAEALLTDPSQASGPAHDESLTETEARAEVQTSGISEPSASSDSMNEFYGLQRSLLLAVLGTSVVAFGAIWFAYSLNVALNYFLGAAVGVLYLRMLAKDVEKLGVSKDKLGKTRLVPLLVVIVATTQIDRLELLPVILGFLTYKAVLFIYALSAAIVPDP